LAGFALADGIGEVQHHAAGDLAVLEAIEDIVDVRKRSSMSALTLPSAAKARHSAMSSRVPTNEPRMVMQLAHHIEERDREVTGRQADQDR
jgi:hypothetical protein